MPTLSGGDLAILDNNLQRSQVYLSMFSPITVMSAKIESINEATVTITDIDGDWDDLIEGMTVLLGTSAGSYNIGKIRLKGFSEDSSILILAQNDMPFQPGDFITVLRYWEIWPVYHRVQVNSGELEVFQDDDVSYSDQNLESPPVCVIGAHTVCEVGGSVYWDASDSWSPVGATINSWSWEFEGGTPSTATGETPGSITYSSTGFFWTFCSIMDENGKTFTARRAVIVCNMTTHAPITKFQMRNLSGGWDEFGWNGEFVIEEEVPLNVYRDNTLCILWHKSWYGPTRKEFGVQQSRTHQIFVGWLNGDTLTRDPYNNTTTFKALGAVPYMKETLNFPVTLEYDQDPEQWWQITDLTVDRAVQFFLRWSSTALVICDFYRSNQALLVKYFDYGEDTISSAINNAIYDRGSFIRCASDHYSTIYLDEEPQIHSGTITYVMDLNDSWWRDEITFEHTQRTSIAWAELSGVYFDGNEPEPMISMAPGEHPLWDGSQAAVGNLICPDQDTLNIWSGRYLGWKNNPFPELILPMAGNFAGVFDTIPAEVVRVTLTGDENRRQYVLDQQGFIIRGVQHSFDGFNLLTDLRCEMLTDGTPGIDGRYPDDPPPPEECIPCDPCDPEYPCEEEPLPSGTAGGWRPCWLSCQNKLYYIQGIQAPPSTVQPDVYDASQGETSFGAFAVDPFDPEGFQFMHGSLHFTDYSPIKYKSKILSGGEPWERPWSTLVSRTDIKDAMKVHFGFGDNSRGMKMVGLEFDINCENVFYVNMDVRVNGGYDCRFMVMVIEYDKLGDGSLFLPSKAPLWESITFLEYHDIPPNQPVLGQADNIRLGAFNLTKTAAGWAAQSNQLYAAGGNPGSANANHYKMNKSGNNYSSDTCKWETSPNVAVTDSAANNMQLRHIFVDPNNPDRLFHWLPDNSVGFPSFEMHDYNSAEVITFSVSDGDPCPPRMSGPGGSIVVALDPCHIYAGDHHGISVTWHPEPGKNGQYIRFFDHLTNMFYYSDDDGATYYPLTPVGDVPLNGSSSSLQKWIISLVQDEHTKLYVAKNSKGNTVIDSITVDHQFCIAVHDPDPTHTDTELEFFDRSGVDDATKGTVRLPLNSYCCAIVPVWTLSEEEV